MALVLAIPFVFAEEHGRNAAAQNVAEEMDIMREASVQPGKPVDLWIEVPIPTTWSFARFEEVVKTTKAEDQKESKLTKNDQLEVLKNKIKDPHKTFDSLVNQTQHERVG